MESITGSVGGTSRVLVALDLLRDEVVRLGDAGLVVTQCRPWVSPTTGRVGWDVVVRAAGADQYEALDLAVGAGYGHWICYTSVDDPGSVTVLMRSGGDSLRTLAVRLDGATVGEVDDYLGRPPVGAGVSGD